MRIEVSQNSITVLAVDIGTSGCRAIICEQDGTIISTAERSYGVTYNDNGIAEQDPEQIFNSFIEVVQQCTAESHVSVDYVVIGSVLHSLMLLDSEGNPLTPLSIWADTRAIGQCQELRDAFELNKWHERTGCLLSPTYPLYRLLWYKEREPALYSSIHKAISIKSYILFRLFGLYVEDHSVASGSGMFNIQSRVWDREILDFLELNEEKLPVAVPVEYQLPDFNSSLIQNFSGRTKWIIGGADGPLAHLGTAGWNQNIASLTIGTSGAVRMKIDNPQILQNSSLWCYVLNGNSYISGLATNNGGNVVDWFVKLLYPGGVDWKELENSMLFSEPDSELFFIPFLFKERDLSRNNSNSGQFIGLKQHHTREDILKAVIEGVVFNAVSLLDQLISCYTDIKAVALSGSLTRLDFVCKLINSTVNLSIIRLSSDNASLLGLTKIAFQSEISDFVDIIEGNVMTDIDSDFEEARSDMIETKKYNEKYNNWKNLSVPNA